LHSVAIVGLEGLTVEGFLLDRLIDLFEIEVVDHQFVFIGEFETGDGEVAAVLRRDFRRQVPAAAVARDGERIGFALAGFGFEIRDRLIAIIAQARQLKVHRLAPGIGARPFAEQAFGRRFTGGQRFLERHQTATEQQERQGDQHATPGFHSILPMNIGRPHGDRSFPRSAWECIH
jgi:hypothetical protein